jgi:hypothetical protein
MADKTGGPAFPCIEVSQDQGTGNTTIHQWSGSGVTLRDYFAAKAIGMFGSARPANLIAELAYEVADAMIEERKK